MSTIEMIELFIDKGVWAYKKLNKNTVEGRKLFRHESVEIEGHTFNCFREYSVFKVGNFLQENLPEADIIVTLDGNNSTLDLTVSNIEQQIINSKMYQLLKDWKFV